MTKFNQQWNGTKVHYKEDGYSYNNQGAAN